MHLMTKIDDTTLRGAIRLVLHHLAQDERSSAAIARAAGVSQPTVSRLRRSRARRERWSRSFNKLCNFYRVPLAEGDTAGRRYNELLPEAILDAWDGTAENGQALLTLIKNLKGLIRPTPSSPGSSRGNR